MEIKLKKLKAITISGGVLILIIGLSACKPAPDPSIAGSSPPNEQSIELTAVPETAVVVELENTEPESVNECLVCHSNQQALMDTANPEVVIESESSGEG